jgi:predicted DNA-binding ribbon-helix-helix protein
MDRMRNVVKYSVTLHGHRTSLSLEPEFRDALEAVARARGRSVNALIAEIDAGRLKAERPRNLSSAVRVWLLDWFRSRSNA